MVCRPFHGLGRYRTCVTQGCGYASTLGYILAARFAGFYLEMLFLEVYTFQTCDYCGLSRKTLSNFTQMPAYSHHNPAKKAPLALGTLVAVSGFKLVAKKGGL